SPIPYVLYRRGRTGCFLLYPCLVVTSCCTIDRWEVCGSTTYLFCRREVSFWHYAQHTSLPAVRAPWVPRPPETVGARLRDVAASAVHRDHARAVALDDQPRG